MSARKITYSTVVCLIAVLYLIYNYKMKFNTVDLNTEDRDLKNIPSNTVACKHPTLQLWPDELKKYFEKRPKPLNCNSTETSNAVYTRNGKLYLSSKYAQSRTFSCHMHTLSRTSDFSSKFSYSSVMVTNGMKMPADFGKVKCINDGEVIYDNLISGISEKPFSATFEGDSKLMNVLMIGYDSTSRENWLRNLPKTQKFFTESLGGTELEWYNIVGDGTPAALQTILTGFHELELPEARRGIRGAKPVDDQPWIWKRLKKSGYVTQWGEEGYYTGTFQYRMLGFDKQPVDHYLRPLMKEVESKEFRKKNKGGCIGSISKHQHILNWIRDMFGVYTNRPIFSFLFFADYTHGSFTNLQLADDELVQFLDFMNKEGYFKNTLLILMSDHGARFSTIRRHVQGKLEERKPYFGLRFPEWFQKTHPEAMKNLKTNSKRLTVPYDIHATFHHILDFSGAALGKRSERGISVLKEIPPDRTCADAGIADHYCACMNWAPVNITNSHVRKAADTAVQFINSEMEKHTSKCENILLFNITQSEMHQPLDSVLKFKGSGTERNLDMSDNTELTFYLYQLRLETIPGHGLFEVTIKRYLKKDTYTLDASHISRINKYGDAPHCISEQYPHLRPYCYCK